MSSDDPTRRVANRETSASASAGQNDIATRRVGQDNAPGSSADPNAVPTRRVGPETGAGPSRTAQQPLGALTPGTVLCGDCIVVSTRQNHETQRPGLFECRSPHGQVMLKVAALEHPPHPGLWTRLPSLRHPHVLKVFRTLKESGRYYEVQEFCGGGTLEDLVPSVGSGQATPSLDWIEQALVPAFASGIHYLHENGLVHRDIKPSNIYFRAEGGQKIIVLGDFDISSALETGRTSRSTQRAAGTWNYSAPEAFPRFVDDEATQLGSAVSRASDYYSFGVVLVELLTGTTSLHQAQFPDLFDFYLQGGRVEIPSGLPGRLTELLQGLLLRNRNLRWGHAELGRWMANSTSTADRKRIQDDGGYRFSVSAPPFNAFERSKPTTLRELAAAMHQEPGVAVEELMSGDVLLNWIGGLDSKLAREIRKQREQWRSFPQLVYLRAGGLLAPDLAWPLRITPKRTAHNAAEWSAEAVGAVKDGMPVTELCGPHSLTQLETWLRHKAGPETDMADAVAAIRGQIAKSSTAPVVILEELSYAFSPQKAYIVAPGVVARTPREIAQKVYGEPKDWQGRGNLPSATYTTAIKRWQAGSLDAWLRQRLGSTPEGKKLAAQCAATRAKFSDAPFAGFEVVLRLLDPTLPPIKIDLEVAPLHPPFLVDHGKELVRTVSYRTEGPGVPYGAWKLEGALPGLQLKQHQMNSRAGELTIRLESANQIPTDKNHRAVLKLDGQFVTLDQGEVELNYRVKKGFTFNPVWFQSRVLRAAAIFAATLVFLAIVTRAVILSQCRAWMARPVVLQGHSGEITGIGFSDQGKILVTSSQDGSVKTWITDMGPQTLDGAAIRTVLGEISSNPQRNRPALRTLASGQPIRTMALTPDGQSLALSRNTPERGSNVIAIWDLNGKANMPRQRLIGNTDRYNEIETVNFSHDGNLVAAGYRNGTIEIWNPKTGTMNSSWTGHTGMYAGVKHVEFSKDGTLLASASDDSTVALWNLPGHQKYADFHGESEWCRAAALSPKTKLLALGNDAHALHVFDWGTRSAMGNYSYHNGNILTLAFSPDGKFLASGGADNVLAIWDTTNWSVRLAYNEPAQVTSVAFSPDGDSLVSGESDGTMKIWPLNQLGLR